MVSVSYQLTGQFIWTHHSQPVQKALPVCLRRMAHIPPETRTGWRPWPTSRQVSRSPAAISLLEQCTPGCHKPMNTTNKTMRNKKTDSILISIKCLENWHRLSIMFLPTCLSINSLVSFSMWPSYRLVVMFMRPILESPKSVSLICPIEVIKRLRRDNRTG